MSTFRNPALYPPELRGRTTPIPCDLLCRPLHYLLPSIAKWGQSTMIFLSRRIHSMSMISDRRLQPRRSSREAALFLCVSIAMKIFLAGCSSAPAPLSIKMYNPETNQTLACNASDPLGRSDLSVLADAVEGCARQLESRGFVREK